MQQIGLSITPFLYFLPPISSWTTWNDQIMTLQIIPLGIHIVHNVCFVGIQTFQDIFKYYIEIVSMHFHFNWNQFCTERVSEPVSFRFLCFVTHWSPTRMNGCWEAARLTWSSTQTLSICADRVSLHRLSKWINIHSLTCPIWQNEWMDVGTDSVFHTDFANLMERNQPKPVVETEMVFWMNLFTLKCFL